MLERVEIGCGELYGTDIPSHCILLVYSIPFIKHANDFGTTGIQFPEFSHLWRFSKLRKGFFVVTLRESIIHSFIVMSFDCTINRLYAFGVIKF